MGRTNVGNRRAAQAARNFGFPGVLIATVVAVSGATALADDTKPAAKPADAPATKPAPAADATTPAKPATTPAAKPAEATEPAPIQPPGSADDINEEIEQARPRHAGLLPNGPVSIFDNYIDDFNAKMNKQFGVKFGMAYTYVYQKASDSDTAHDDGMAGDADIYARAHFFGDEKSPNRGIVGVNGEYRHDFNDQVPKDIAGNYGGLWRTTNGFGRQDMALTQAWWEQHMAGDKIVLTAGKMDPDNYYNKNRYQSDSTAFLSQSFSSNPAREFPSNGLGFNGLAKVAKEFYVTAGVQDANGDKQKSGFHTIDQGQLFGAGEVGWTPTFENQGQGAYRLTVWGIEKATIAGTPEDHGVALSCEQPLCNNFVPFFRAAWSQADATGVRRFAAGGVGLEGVFAGRKADLTGIGVAWGDPKSHDDRQQFGAEVFHRFQLAPDIQLTVGYQYVVDPSYAPSSNHDPVGVFEIRVRIEF